MFVGDVLERVADERDDVVVGEAVHDVPSLPPTGNEVLRVQQSQSVRNGGRVLVHGLGDLAHAPLALSEQLDRA